MMKWPIFTALLLAGCVSQTETITLKNASGQVAQCGPYPSPGIGSAGLIGGQTAMAEERLRNCVTDFQKAGYQRVGQ